MFKSYRPFHMLVKIITVVKDAKFVHFFTHLLSLLGELFIWRMQLRQNFSSHQYRLQYMYTTNNRSLDF